MEKCIKSGNCIVSQSPTLKPIDSDKSYSQLYCFTNESIWKECRRYHFSESVGSCPDFLLPDMKITDKEIVARMRNWVV